jgi:hypothetical protein
MTRIEESLLVAAYYRGGRPEDRGWTSNCDQVVTLSLFYTEDISAEECAERFFHRRYVGGLYREDGTLEESVEERYRVLIRLIGERPEWIEGGGDLGSPADPTFTACRLTAAGRELARSLVATFRPKPEFPNWPDRP